MNRANKTHRLLPFVQDGYKRALDGIREEIEAKYADEFKAATDANRPLVLKRIDAEIADAAKRLATPLVLW